MRDKIAELIDNNKACSFECSCEDCTYNDEPACFAYRLADALIAHGVTKQTTPISYKRLLKLAEKMHTWIFLNTGNEQAVYDELGLTEEENYVFGYGGKLEMPSPATPKEET